MEHHHKLNDEVYMYHSTIKAFPSYFESAEATIEVISGNLR
jgi:hypothetical protein